MIRRIFMRKARHRNEIIILLALFALYLFALFRMTVFRDSVPMDQGVNLIPLSTIAEYLQEITRGHRMAGIVNLFGNLAIFLPLGYMVASLIPKMRRLGRILVLALCLSMAIEASQYALAHGTADIDDVLLNVIGAALGYGLFVLTKKVLGTGKRTKRTARKFAILTCAIMATLACIGLFGGGGHGYWLDAGALGGSGEAPGFAETSIAYAYSENDPPTGYEYGASAPGRPPGAGRSTGMKITTDVEMAPGDANGAVGYRQSRSGEVAWYLILVNKWNYIPDGYEADLMELKNGQKVDRRIYPALQEMFDAAREEGVYPVVSHGYRTARQQKGLFDAKIYEYRAAGYSPETAKSLAEAWVAVPGTSEHQLGLAVDIGADEARSNCSEVYDWLSYNAWKFGFVYRYPSSKSEITGVADEPWHYRYVGVEAASEMYFQGLCLEEYLKGND